MNRNLVGFGMRYGISKNKINTELGVEMTGREELIAYKRSR